MQHDNEQSGLSAVELRVVKDLDEISQAASDLIATHFCEIESAKWPRAIALSGGSTPGRLHQRLSSDAIVRNSLPWDAIHFFWGDERHVPPEHPQSNYRLACETLFASAPIPSSNIHRVHAEEPDAAKVAENYERELFSFFNLKTDQVPRFDCVLLGIGSDGHTASLFPGTDALKEKNRLVVANRVEKFQTDRITMTAPVLNNGALIIFLVSGQEKAEVLKKILEGEYRPELLPAQLIQPVHGRLVWLVDQDAAGCLTGSIRA